MSWQMLPPPPYTEAQEGAIDAGEWNPDRETWNDYLTRRGGDDD